MSPCSRGTSSEYQLRSRLKDWRLAVEVGIESSARDEL